MKNKQAVFVSKTVPWLYLAPTILVLLVFVYYPGLKVIINAFYRDNFFLGTRSFIGFENFKNMFTGLLAPEFRQILVQTVIFSILVIALSLSISVLLAYEANKKIKGAKIYRMLLIWPFALSSTVAGIIFSFLFNSEVGLINSILNNLIGIKPKWFSNPVLAFSVSIFVCVWKNIGYNVVFFLAGLQNISHEPLEAAEIDGASEGQRFFRILLPLLGPVTFFLIFTNITYSLFDSFAVVDVLTKGGPVGQGFFGHTGVTTTLMYSVYQEGFGGSSNMGFASAQSLVLFVIVIAMTIVQFGGFKDKVNYDV